MTPAPRSTTAAEYRGDNRALIGMVLGVLTFWLFAQTTLNIGPVMAKDLGIDMAVMNIAIVITALFSGMLIVVLGNTADRIGRVKMANIGNLLGIVGALLVAFAGGPLTVVMLMTGRILAGVSTACIMPSTLALVKAYWQGKDRQRAVSIWSIGTWGGSGFCSFVGGILAASAFGWRSIFILAAVASLISILLMRHIPESKSETSGPHHTDYLGITSFAVAMVAIQIVLTQGSRLGWTSPIILLMGVLFIASFVAFFRHAKGNTKAFIDFRLFSNKVFTGTTVSNMALNGTAGMIAVSLWLLQKGYGMSPAAAGNLTLAYAISVVALIRLGEVLLRKFGAKRPMLIGIAIVALAISSFMLVAALPDLIVPLSIFGFLLMGVGLAVFATPATDTALNALPASHAGSGAGIFKMGSSLGSSFGVALCTSMFAALETSGLGWFDGLTPIAVNQAGIAALGVALSLAILAFVVTLIIVPRDAGKLQAAEA